MARENGWPRIGEEKVRLRAGDTLALFTDGLTEARRSAPANGHAAPLVGMSGVAELLAAVATASPDEMADALLANVLAGAPSSDDDLALLVLRVGPGREPQEP